jgi:hypothetical protein
MSFYGNPDEKIKEAITNGKFDNHSTVAICRFLSPPEV